MEIKTDCKHYLAYKPCTFHKKDRRLCANCQDYAPVLKRILIIKLDALGDVLRTTSILPLLTAKYPGAEITWITRNNAIPLIELNPHIDRIFPFESNFNTYLDTEQFDLGICLDADPKSASILAKSNCSEKIGFITNKAGKVIPANPEATKWYHMGVNDDLKSNNRETYHDIINQICRLEGAPHKPILNLHKSNYDFAENFSSTYNLKKYSKVIGINTGGGMRWQYKKWLLPYYISLIKMLNNNYKDLGIILFGGPEEITFNKQIKDAVGDMIVDAGCDNSLLDFGALVTLCDVHFTTDSLGMHLSIAQDITTVVVVGPTSPWELDVFGNGEIIYPKELDCVACYLAKCSKEVTCMQLLNPSMIFNVLKKHLSL